MDFQLENLCRRPLDSKNEDKLWKFVYQNKVAENNYRSLLEVFKEFRRRGNAKIYGLTEIEFHFHSVMVPNLHKTDALTPREIMNTFYTLSVPIRPDLRPILSLMCPGVRARCDKTGRLIKLRINEPRPADPVDEPKDTSESSSPTPSSSSSFRMPTPPTTVPLHVETAMWRHLAENSTDLDAITIQTLAFWRKMKLGVKDRAVITPNVLVNFFRDKLRHYFFALDLPKVDKIELIDALYLKLSPGKQKWLLRVDGIAVDTNEKFQVEEYRFWRDEEPQIDPTGEFWGLEGYRPLELYGHGWKRLSRAAEPSEEQMAHFRQWMEQMREESHKTQLIQSEVEDIVMEMIEELEDLEACEGIAEEIQVDPEILEEFEDVVGEKNETSKNAQKRVNSSSSASPNAKIPKIDA